MQLSQAEEGRPGVLPADVYAVKDLGVETWQKAYFWPVSDEDYFELLDRAFGAFDAMYAGLQGAARDLVLADSGFVNFLAQYLQGLAVERFCREKGVRLALGQLARAQYRPDWQALPSGHDLLKQAGSPWPWKARRLAKNVAFNRHLPLHRNLVGLLKSSVTWGLGSFSGLKADYLRARGLYCDHQYLSTLPALAPSGPDSDLPESLNQATETCLEGLQDYGRERLGVAFDAALAGQWWLRRLEALCGVYRAVRSLKNLPETLLLTEVAKPLNKTVALAARSRGTRVVGFHHGNDMGNSRRKGFSYSEYSHCDAFVCPTQASARFHAREHRMNSISRLAPTQFLSAETGRYEARRRACSREAFPDRFRSIMIIGYPMHVNRSPYRPGSFFVFQLDLELRVARLLKQQGYEVIYKMHPERRREAEGLFNGLIDRIVAEPFETSYQETDALFFGYTGTSTFGFALCTNKPVFVIDFKGQEWNREAYDLLRRRCTMIPAEFDETNRIRFDEGLLLERLDSRPEVPDFAYVEEIMSPSGKAGSFIESAARSTS